MDKRLGILILAFFISAATIRTGLSAETARQTPLWDGSVLTGEDGKLTTKNGNEVWLFEFDSDVSDDKGRIRAGTSLELLPSAALEKMTADAQGRCEIPYRLWARVTRYKGENFIFPTYFLPLGEIDKPQVSRETTTQQPPIPETQKSQPTTPRLAINEPNDILSIPQEVIDKLKTRPVVTVKRPQANTITRPAGQPPKRQTSQQNTILADRTGFIVKKAEYETRYDLFVFDSLGRNVQGSHLQLLPCQALEAAEKQQLASAEPLRFKIAGIVTEYKGERFLLLQKATQVYSHGNFGR